MKRQFTREERKALDETAILIEKLKASDSLEESTYTDLLLNYVHNGTSIILP